MKKLICRLRGHDLVRLSVGKCWMDVCLRCGVKVQQYEEF